MHRQAVQTVLGRGSLAAESCRAATTLTAQCRSSRQAFSTSISRLDAPDGRDGKSAPKNNSSSSSSSSSNNKNSRPRSRERSQAAASAIRNLNAPARAPGGNQPRQRPASGIDARALGNMIRQVPLDSSKVITIRKVPAGLGSKLGSRLGTGLTRTGDKPVEGGLRRHFPRLQTGEAAAEGGAPRFQRGGGGFRAAGRGTRPATGRGRGGPRGRKMAPKQKKPKAAEASGGKLVYSVAEKAVIDRIEQGEVTEYKPRVTLRDLSGYGPAIASDTLLAKVESMMQTMRIMGGGAAFNSDLSPTMDYEAAYKRHFHEQKPIFTNSLAEKRWMRRAWGRRSTRKVAEETKEAMIDLAIRGKYESPTSFVDMTDIKGSVANYHSQTFSYKHADAKAFMDKLDALLPADVQSKLSPGVKQA